MIQIWDPEDPATVIWLDSRFARDDGLLGAVALDYGRPPGTGKGSLPAGLSVVSAIGCLRQLSRRRAISYH